MKDSMFYRSIFFKGFGYMCEDNEDDSAPMGTWASPKVPHNLMQRHSHMVPFNREDIDKSLGYGVKFSPRLDDNECLYIEFSTVWWIWGRTESKKVWSRHEVRFTNVPEFITLLSNFVESEEIGDDFYLLGVTPGKGVKPMYLNKEIAKHLILSLKDGVKVLASMINHDGSALIKDGEHRTILPPGTDFDTVLNFCC